jgi:hypothetical protein
MLLLVAWLSACGAKGGPGGSALCNVDADGDGFGTATTVAVTSCTDDGVADNANDCDDTSASIHPGGTETAADGIDQDCDGNDLCYEDLDGDGYGGVARLARDCSTDGLVGRAGDCNDFAAAVYPGAEEIPADTVDQDCDGAEACFADLDGDGFSGPTIAIGSDLDCTDPGEAIGVDDCLDVGADGPATFPGAAENESDSACMTDADGDGYGSRSPAEGVTPGGDCDDADASPCPVIHVGYDEEFPGSGHLAADYLLTCRLDVNSSTTVTDLAVIGKAAGANVRMALYTDADGPDALVVEVPSAPLVAGALEMPVDLTSIDPGYYWIAAVFDDDVLVGATGTGRDDCGYRNLWFWETMPDPFGGAYTPGAILNFYIVGWE